MNIRDILFMPHNFCSDVIYLKKFNYIVIENLYIEEYKNTCQNFNGQKYIDIIETHVKDTNSSYFGYDGRLLISRCLIIFCCCYSNIPRKNIWEYKIILNHEDDIIGLRFCIFYLNNEKAEVTIINKTTNNIIKFIPIDGTTFIYNTQNYVSIGHSRRCAADKLLNTNEKIKYITTILDYNPLNIIR